MRDLAACDLEVNGRLLRAATAPHDVIVNFQAKEDAIRHALLLANGTLMATWPPGRIRTVADLISTYVGGTHAMSSSRIAVQLLFGRRGLVDMCGLAIGRHRYVSRVR